MPVTIPSRPKQLDPPSAYGHRISVDTDIRIVDEGATVSVTIIYEVQEHHVARGYRVSQGGSRVESLPSGTHRLRHWFVLVGPPTPPPNLNVVDMRVRAQLPTGNSSSRGFAAQMQQGG